MSEATAHLSAAREHHRAGRLAAAEAAYRAGLGAEPDSVECLGGLATVIAADRTRLPEAEALLRAAAERLPASAELAGKLAAVLGMQGRHDQAAAILREVVQKTQADAACWNNLGVALESGGEAEQAVNAYRQAIARRPAYPEAHNNLGNALRALGRLSEAESAHREAILLSPGYWRAWNNLAATLSAAGRAEEALACYRRVVELRPADAVAGSDLLLAMHYPDDIPPGEIFAAHRQWARRCRGGERDAAVAGEIRNGSQASRLHAAGRRLRVGYVSPDFRDYPAARFFGGVLRHHDRNRIDICCYSDVARPDATTSALRTMGHAWRDTAGLSDERVAQLVNQDQIDILVDLAGHMNNPRLTMFARRPAGVQVTYLGYPNTTGLATMDYRLSDAWHDPPGAADELHTEQLVRLPRCCWAYLPGEDLPAVGALPAASRGHVTFAVMNRLVKVTPRMIGRWAAVLSAVPGSRLRVLAGTGAQEPGVRRLFERHGVDGRRLDLLGAQPRSAYLERFAEADLALDTFPYAGMTTTCDGLWMGVPTVTLAGSTHVSRTGVSILSAVGMPELIAATPEEYVAIAMELGRDLPRLAAIRAGLRARTQASPLGDAAGLTREIEAAFERMSQGDPAPCGDHFTAMNAPA